MKFSCNRDNFTEGINIAMKAILGKTTMPTLECFLIEAKDDHIKLTSNDMQLGIETTIPAEVTEPGMVLMNAKTLSDYVRHLPQEKVEVEVDDNNTILIFSGSTRFEHMGLGDDDFPRLPEISFDQEITISQFTLKEMIRQTIFSISSKENNKLLTGELFEINKDELRIASLDLIRVSIRKIKLDKEYDHIKVVIPGKTLNELSKILSTDKDDMIKISFSKNHVKFEFKDTLIISRLIEGNFFNIDQMLKNNYETKVKVNKGLFFGCIERASLLIHETDKNPVVFNIKDGEMKMEIKSTHSSMNEDVTVEKEGNDLRIGINPKYIIDVLRVIDDEDINLYFFNANSPCFIKNKEESYIYLILPINI
ncbi:MAG: DNA polymerase III subunit beta [Eubacterium sp.]|nr:DNA polymerase III subunit beta [Eubacterium sp.]